MIKEKLDEWKVKHDMFGNEIDEETIGPFLEESYARPFECFCALAYAIYELEICLEGLLEDMEIVNGQVDQERQK
jgi:hypothetical protein